MKEYFEFDLPEEDTIVFQLTDAAYHTPVEQLRAVLQEHVDNETQRVAAAGTPREAEMEQRSTDFARLLLSHVSEGRSLPNRQAYTLKS